MHETRAGEPSHPRCQTRLRKKSDRIRLSPRKWDISAVLRSEGWESLQEQKKLAKLVYKT